jgi:hypothetical protein
MLEHMNRVPPAIALKIIVQNHFQAALFLGVTLLIEREGGAWTAQCLEYDIAAQASSFSDITYEICRVLAAHMVVATTLEQEPFVGLGRAPNEYWEMFDSTKVSVQIELSDHESEEIPHPSMLPELNMRIAERRFS